MPELASCRGANISYHFRSLKGYPYHGYTLISFRLPRLKKFLIKVPELSCDPVLNCYHVIMSKVSTMSKEIPCPAGLSYRPFQLEGIRYLLDHPAALLADEMGLGKTVQVIGMVNADQQCKSILIVCPPHLKYNWLREWQRWTTRNLTVAMVDPKEDIPTADVIILSEAILARPQIKKALRLRNWDAIVVDESHHFKNPTTQRTLHLYGGRGVKALDAPRRIALSGTPILNRPIEIQTTLAWLDRPEWYDRWKFARAYCDPKRTQFGWDLSGHNMKTLPNLQRRLKGHLMLRRLKRDVLPELPKKQRQIIELDTPRSFGIGFDIWKKLLKGTGASTAKDLLEDEQAFRQALKLLEGSKDVPFADISRVRRELADAKLDAVRNFIKDAVDGSDHKIIVWFHHRTMGEHLAFEFGQQAVLYYGGLSSTKKDVLVQRFNEDPKCRLFLGSLKTAGTGLTLTASNHVIFAEMFWVPGDIQQAEDRPHRIGQTKNVLIQYLVAANTLDAHMGRVVVRKLDIVDTALDKDEELDLLLS